MFNIAQIKYPKANYDYIRNLHLYLKLFHKAYLQNLVKIVFKITKITNLFYRFNLQLLSIIHFFIIFLNNTTYYLYFIQ